jgi:endonuclease/exonuclease/phosphatase (EEP) superfamily protein YafD
VSPRWVGRVLLAPVWLVVMGLLGLVAARVLAFDDRRIFMLADAYTLWIYLPAYAIVVAAVCFRFRTLAVAGAVVVVAQLAWVVPPVFDTVAAVPTMASVPRLRVVSANLAFTNFDHTLVRELSGYDADVLFLEEVTPAWWDAIVREGLLASYPEHAESIHNGASGIAVLSRLPLSDVHIANPEIQPIISATMTFQRLAVRLVAVHPVAPIETFARNQDQQRAITAIVRRSARPRIVAGDFNSTMYNAWMQELTGLGLREAHEAVGRSFATTWPNGERHLPPIRIDHVLVDPPLIPTRAAEGRGQGSDHRPIIVDLAVIDRPRRVG